uniref:Uncharacterized protein n=1 Tax=Rhizophora mucronata TaxID=61149 RepID=A0A2P2R477_RHIMU
MKFFSFISECLLYQDVISLWKNRRILDIVFIQ